MNKTIELNDLILNIFEEYISRIDDVTDFVNHVNFIGSYLANSPCSKLHSETIENRIKYFQGNYNFHSNLKKKGTLHVATQLYLTGGHTRVIENWINFSNEEINDVVVIDQYRKFHLNVPEHVNILIFDNTLPTIEKIQGLNLLYQKYEKIVFHIHQFDTIPLIAMGTNPSQKFYFYNHADHTFSIGTSLVDEVYDMSTAGQIFSLNFRGAKSSKVIPFPLNTGIDSEHFLTKKEIRRSLGLDSEKKIILTVGSSYKFIPNEEYNLFERFSKIASLNPNFLFVFIGPDSSFNKYVSPDLSNILLLGNQSKKTVYDYYQASDLYIDSLPIGGGFALIEAILFGLPIITFDNGFNAFDAASKFRRSYAYLEDDVYELLTQESALKSLHNKCLVEASKHQKQNWNYNFNEVSVSLINSLKLTPDILNKYCKLLFTKYPYYYLPKVKFRLDNNIILQLGRILPFKYLVSVLLIGHLVPFVRAIASTLIDWRLHKQ